VKMRGKNQSGKGAKNGRIGTQGCSGLGDVHR
jgi:hypothetical protein